MCDGHADGRAVGVGLYHAGQLRLLCDAVNVRLRIAHRAPLWCDDKVTHEALGQILIHGNGAAQIPAAGVGNAQQIEGCLHAAVLAAGAVQREEDNIRHAAHGQHVPAEHAVALIAAAAAHLFQIRLAHGNGIIAAEAVLHRENILKGAFIVLQPQKHIHQNGLMTACTQRTANLGSAGERNVALHAKASGQYNNFHCDFLPFRMNPIPILF